MPVFAIEGVNGSGKSTVSKQVAHALDYEHVRFPGDSRTQLGKPVRELLYNGGFTNKHTKLFLFLADMAEVYGTLDTNKNYITDRSIVSTVAYQSYEGVSKELVYHCSHSAGIYINHVFYLDVDADIAANRCDNRTEKTLGGFRNQPIEFYEQIDKEYREALKGVAHTVIDAEQSTENIVRDILDKIEELK